VATVNRFPRSARLTLIALVLLPAHAWAWGSATHHYIAQNYSKHLPPNMDGLRAYDSVVDAHVTDADTRKSSTPGESEKHFIDIDSYSEFLAGAMPHDSSQIAAKYGASFVENTGVVPWTVGDVMAILTAQFAAQNWSAAALTIADLCHYVGDSTQPLHCCKNYDGQLTGNNGIHSRYETTMMGQHIADLSTPVMSVVYYANPVDALFGIVSGSWSRVNDLLAADNTAKAAAGGSTSSTTYYNSLWANTQAFTRVRVDSATVATASMVYTAWMNAGHPTIPGSTASVGAGPTSAALVAGPSPFREALSIAFTGRGPLSVDVFDVRGRAVAQLAEGAPGGGRVTWQPEASVGPGLYFVRLTGPGVNVTRMIARLR